MKLEGNTILITGGSSGIGLALAERFVKLGNVVIICSRREDRLKEAKRKIPQLHIKRCDVSKEEERKELVAWVAENFNDMNFLVNNAGVQFMVDLKKGVQELEKNEGEIDINLKSYIYLSAHFIPLLSEKREAAILNVSSGLGIIPFARYPIYSATKAATRSFTKSLRHQLKETTIKVFDVMPPLVHDTRLHYGKPLEKTENSISASELVDEIIEGLRNDQYEIAAGPTKNWLRASKDQADQMFSNMNR